MKTKSILYEKISGSISTITGRSSAGGNTLRTKNKPTNAPSQSQEDIRQFIASANKDWKLMDISVREDWNEYAKSLTIKNQVGNLSQKTGHNAFSGAYVLMKQSTMNTNQILTSAPSTTGYLPSPEIWFNIVGANVKLNILGDNKIQFSTYLSPKFKNTINQNISNYYYYINFNITPPDRFNLPASVRNGRFFVKTQRIEIDGGISLGKTYKEDFN